MDVNSRNLHNPATNNNVNNQADHNEGGRISSSKDQPNARGRSSPPPMASGKNYALSHRPKHEVVPSKANQSGPGKKEMHGKFAKPSSSADVKGAGKKGEDVPELSSGGKFSFLNKSSDKREKFVKQYNDYQKQQASQQKEKLEAQKAAKKAEDVAKWEDMISGAGWDKTFDMVGNQIKINKNRRKSQEDL